MYTVQVLGDMANPFYAVYKDGLLVDYYTSTEAAGIAIEVLKNGYEHQGGLI